MSDLDFELDAEKYTPEELEQILKLKFPYSSDDIEEELKKLRKQIMTDKNLEETKQREIMSFLESVHHKLNKNNLIKPFQDFYNDINNTFLFENFSNCFACSSIPTKSPLPTLP